MGIFNNNIQVKNIKNVALSGLTDEVFSGYINSVFNSNDSNILIVTDSLYEANMLCNTINTYSNNCYLFPMDDFLTSEAIAISPDLLINRLETINEIINNNKVIVVTNLMGYLRYLPDLNSYKNSIITIKKNNDFDITKLINMLTNLGYTKESIVTKTGEYSLRGFILDIYPIGMDNPVRIEFFGDTVESIRLFSPDNQKSIKEIDLITIYPYTEFIVDKEDIDRKQKFLSDYTKVVSIYDYLNNPITFFKDINIINASSKKIDNDKEKYRLEKDIDYKGNYMFNFNDIKVNNINHYLSVNNILDDKKFTNIDFKTKEITPFYENIELINKFIKEKLYLNNYVIVYLKEISIKNFTKELNSPYIITDINNLELNKVNIIKQSKNKGYIFNNYVVLTEYELFNHVVKNKKYRTSFKYSSKIKDLNKLKIGDYVVHVINGIGIYNGITTLKFDGLIKDYVEVLYANKDKLYIPAEKIDLLSKYSGNDGKVPKINKLGGLDFAKTKLRVREKIHDIADKLLKIYAEREMKKGFSFSKDTNMQLEFENNFIYTPTIDQIEAIKEIKSDMEASRPMDRLLCGDVGFGKTEVAFRAIFKAILDSKQVLYLCPTTILSNQQYNNAKERFKDFPINIGLLNRFTSPSNKKRILEGLKDGTIDLVFGTHRLLSDDVKVKDLGLLVIDEEQRFGVTHKEKIKEYKSNVDVLTLTATPIPRTLQMSMVGIRSLSLIETPPVDRYPVETYVLEESKEIIKDAINKELARNGQIFILYNRIESIEKKAFELNELVPNARIVIAHGKLSKEEIETRMNDFINHEYDILLCTTIIETGIDIPNVNTLIIYDSDRFGLSQLYQIRGRVGRSNKIAYAYLMYHSNKILNEDAKKRLNALKDFTELGSGFSIAARDLSIRGAGDILGSEQSGFIDAVGIDLYLKLLNDEVLRLKGLVPKDEEELNTKPLINVSTHIGDNYTDDDNLKIEVHKLINSIENKETFNSVKETLEDRFGRLDESIIIYMYEEWFEKLAKKYEVENVNKTKNFIEVYLSKDITSKIDGEKLFEDSFKISNMFRFKMLNDRLIIVFDTIKQDKHYIYYLVELFEKIKFKN